jgi:hypothetical protein
MKSTRPNMEVMEIKIGIVHDAEAADQMMLGTMETISLAGNGFTLN